MAPLPEQVHGAHVSYEHRMWRTIKRIIYQLMRSVKMISHISSSGRPPKPRDQMCSALRCNSSSDPH